MYPLCNFFFISSFCYTYLHITKKKILSNEFINYIMRFAIHMHTHIKSRLMFYILIKFYFLPVENFKIRTLNLLCTNNAPGKCEYEKSNIIFFLKKNILFSHAYMCVTCETGIFLDGIRQIYNFFFLHSLASCLHILNGKISTLQCFIWIHVTFKWLQKCDKIKLTAYKVHIFLTLFHIVLYWFKVIHIYLYI